MKNGQESLFYKGIRDFGLEARPLFLPQLLFTLNQISDELTLAFYMTLSAGGNVPVGHFLMFLAKVNDLQRYVEMSM